MSKCYFTQSVPEVPYSKVAPYVLGLDGDQISIIIRMISFPVYSMWGGRILRCVVWFSPKPVRRFCSF